MRSKSASNIINVAISTVNRPEKYLYKTTARLRKDLPIRMIVGSPDYDYLKRYSRNPHIEIIGIEPEAWNTVKNYTIIHKALWNYWRCLVYGVKPGFRKGLMILEDDVIPAKGWEERLHATIEQIESEYGDEYVLALHTWYTELSKPVGGRFFKSYPAASFTGTQAMYYPEAVRLGFAEYLRKDGVESFHIAYDYMLREYLMSTGIPCFATTPCLFQHIGVVTTGLSSQFANAACFLENFPSDD